jgi:class 3 adenylate cyclase
MFLRNVGIKGRLLLAFYSISLFAVLAAVVALLAFGEVRSALDNITRERMPASFAALELSRQVEHITSAAPTMLTGKTQADRMRMDSLIRTDLAKLQKLLTDVESEQPNNASISDIRGSVVAIRQNLAQLQRLLDPYKFSDMLQYLEEGSNRAQAEALLRNNSEASARLAIAVNRFVEEQRAEVRKALADVSSTQNKSAGVLIGMVALSLVGSALIVWLYVGRSIIRRLVALSQATLAIAGGNLKAPLPVDSGTDEIGRMADALRIFRDTANEVERVGRLKRFLVPQVAELIVSSGDESILDSHRRDVAVLFCDLRGFTSFAETAEPEEIMDTLREYHACLGQLVKKYSGTLERFTGDGLIVLFNDPLPCPDPCVIAARMAVEMRSGVNQLIPRWRHHGTQLGFGIGIAYGYATLGRVGFGDRFDYTAIGSVVNLAARLCDRAKAGEILVDTKVHSAIYGLLDTEALGEFSPKGFSRPVELFNITMRTN